MDRHQKGFTLVELLVVIVVLAILGTLAVPGFQSLIERNSITTTTNGFVVALQYARSEALRRGMPVVLRPRSECPDDLSGWECGWRVETRDDNGGTVVLRESDALPDRIDLPETPDSDSGVRFVADGMADNEAQFRLRIASDGDVRQQRLVEISPTGNVATCDPDASSGCDD